MGLVLQAFIGIIFVAVSLVLFNTFEEKTVPVYPDTWWGDGDPSTEDPTVKPFQINIPKKVCDELINVISLK